MGQAIKLKNIMSTDTRDEIKNEFKKKFGKPAFISCFKALSCRELK